MDYIKLLNEYYELILTRTWHSDIKYRELLKQMDVIRLKLNKSDLEKINQYSWNWYNKKIGVV